MALNIEQARLQARQQVGALPDTQVETIRRNLVMADDMVLPEAGLMQKARIKCVSQLWRLLQASRLSGVLRTLWAVRFLSGMRRDIAELCRDNELHKRALQQISGMTGREENVMSTSPQPQPVHSCFERTLMLDAPELPAATDTALINSWRGSKPLVAERFFSDLRFIHTVETAWPLLKMQEQRKKYSCIAYVQGAEFCDSKHLIQQVETLLDHLAPAGVFIMQGLHPDESALITRIYGSSIQAVPANFITPILHARKMRIKTIENIPRNNASEVPAYWRITAELPDMEGIE